MADLVVQGDGAVVAGADAYVSLDFFRSYWEDEAPAVVAAATDGQCRAAIRAATIWVDGRYDFIGERSTQDLDRLELPRTGFVVVYDAEDGIDFRGGLVVTSGRTADYSGVIPKAFKQAVCEAAKLHLEEPLNAAPDHGGVVIREKVGPLETEFDTDAPAERSFDFIDNILADFVRARPGAAGRLARF